MNRVMPDVVSAERPDFRGKLEWVGMDKVELPVRLGDNSGQLMSTPALADLYVNLTDETAKGIHMSRLFIAASSAFEDSALNPKLVDKVLSTFLDTHEGISDQAKIVLNFEYLTKRPSLKSNNKAWRNYPISIIAQKKRGEDMKIELGIDVKYSSTCPCSAALSRQLNQEAFKSKFEGKEDVSSEEVLAWLGTRESVAATPHAQRSSAEVFVTIAPCSSEFGVDKFINALESALGTPVQAAVKREDEQEFARLNASNLMFGEDASRRLQDKLNSMSEVLDFRGKVSHFESLHPHDAVSSFRKNY